ncbi:hypothetical protein ACFSQ3_10195 [Sphingobacterium corticis]|uniref:Uncharacterized protein n=1 Tax=Sphingobacterium corticis TaxID=1812823 RepID=A0ABW5NMP7_9SPHI
MENKTKSTQTVKLKSYLPVAWEYREIIEELIAKQASGKIFYFDADDRLQETGKVRLVKLEGDEGAGLFVRTDGDISVRIDRIITVFGKLGAAYDEYNAFSVCGMGCDPDNNDQ